MAGSLLSAVGLPELITRSIEEYERRALELARNREGIARAKTKLTQARATATLYDSGRFCRHLEAAYRTMVERVRRGEAPASFSVQALPGS
jgi:predicted O-linked N-acetylglucosamine transferase (SPINDLY family)